MSGNPVAKVIHRFGRADRVDRDALRRFAGSINRFLDPEGAQGAKEGGIELKVSRAFGGAYVLDQLWSALGIPAALGAAAAGRRLDARAPTVRQSRSTYL